MTASADDASGRMSFLDVVVLFAMAVTALAFAAGLIVNTGVDPMAGGIAAAALFLVMASSHFAITKATRPTSVSGRLDEIEEALIVLDSDLQRIDQVEDDVARLDLLTDKVERLDKAVTNGAGITPLGGATEGGEQLERLSSDLERLTQQLEILRSEFESETRSQRDQVDTELRSLEVAIKDLSREVIASPAFAAAETVPEPLLDAGEAPLGLIETEAVTRDPGDDEAIDLSHEEPIDLEPDEADDITVVLVEETTLELGDNAREFNLAETGETNISEVGELDISETDETNIGETGDINISETGGLDLGEMDEINLAEVETRLKGSSGSLTERLAEAFAFEDDVPAVKQAIEAGRIDLYVAPIVSLPGRKLCYLDAAARFRDETDEVLPVGESLAAAGREGLLPRIDNVMLVKSVQLLRRLGGEATLSGVFCPLSPQSLSDAEFFPELVEFLEENSTLGDSLVFQLGQNAIGDLGSDERNGLKTIGRLGFAFALDEVISPDADYAALRDHFFRFVKIDAGRLLDDGAGAPAGPQDMATHLDRFDLKLVACGVDSEHGLSRLMEIGVDLAEGALFASARPANAALFRELEEASAV